MINDQFYAQLPAMTEFDQFSDFTAYAPLPEDWVVLTADIHNSTNAIEAGQYKAVNMVGASVITTVLNQCGDVQIPFVFGGDGGALAVPGRLAEAGSIALRQLQAHAEPVFGLTLRAAAIPVARLRRDGYDVRVRRFVLNGSNHLALFDGGGIAHADKILKTAPPDDPDLLKPGTQDPPPDLEGLSCRWEPMTASRGQMIALMVQPVAADAPQEYARILSELTRILDQDLPHHAPVRDETLRFRWPPRGLWLEAKASAGSGSRLLSYARGVLTALMQVVCHKRKVRIGDYDGARYLEELKAQTDFRKFDGCLRTVLDCTPGQVEAIETWLSAEYREQRLIYGLHVAREALMTCLVFSLEQSEHIHFVDAADGGFARAARDFKARQARIAPTL